MPWKNCRDSKFDMEQEDSKHFADFAMLILEVCIKSVSWATNNACVHLSSLQIPMLVDDLPESYTTQYLEDSVRNQPME